VNETLADARKFASHLIEEHALPFLSDRVDDLKLLLHDKLGHAVVDLAHNEAVGRMAFESLYEFLPAPVRLVVNAPAGGTADVAARIIGEGMSAAFEDP